MASAQQAAALYEEKVVLLVVDATHISVVGVVVDTSVVVEDFAYDVGDEVNFAYVCVVETCVVVVVVVVVLRVVAVVVARFVVVVTSVNAIVVAATSMYADADVIGAVIAVVADVAVVAAALSVDVARVVIHFVAMPSALTADLVAVTYSARCAARAVIANVDVVILSGAFVVDIVAFAVAVAV